MDEKELRQMDGERKNLRSQIRGLYDKWKCLEKGSISNISGANPTDAQVQRVLTALERENELLRQIAQVAGNLSGQNLVYKTEVEKNGKGDS